VAWLKGQELDGYVEISKKVRFMNDVQSLAQNLVGDTFYVRDNGSNSANGKSPGKAFLTVYYALSKCGAYDKIVILPQSSTTLAAMVEDNTIALAEGTHNGVKIIGAMTSFNTMGPCTIHSHVAQPLITIQSHAVELANFCVYLQGASTAIQVNPTVPSVAAAWRTHIHDMSFLGVGVALTAIDVGIVGSDAPATCIERCAFMEFATQSINCSMGYMSAIKDCHFQVGTGANGITYWTNGTSRPHCLILGNKFFTLDNTNGVGISLSATPTAGYLMIDDNHFVNFNNDAHCISAGTNADYCGVNYNGSAAITTA